MVYDTNNPLPIAQPWQIQLFRDNNEAFASGKRCGERGRGSRARYRRAVVDFIADHKDEATIVRVGMALGYDLSWWRARCHAAARRATALLHRLDAEGGR
jgi:hypothetical protein